MMRAVIGLLAVGLCVQAAFGKVHVTFEGVHPIDQEGGHGFGLANVLEEAPLANNVPDADAVPRGSRELQPSRPSEHRDHRELASVRVWIHFWFLIVDTFYRFRVTIRKEDGTVFTEVVEFTAITSIHYWRVFVIDDSFLNEDMTDVCDTCTFEEEQLDCPLTGCDQDIVVQVFGDTHMVGLLGQKIDWAGVDNAWYCLLSDGPGFHVNVRLSAPMPKEFPDRQLISAVSVLTDDGLHSLVVEVKDPYTTTTNGCPKDLSVPCLADGGFRILVDGEESAAMQVPAENARLPGASPVIVSAANLPAECRPFGGDRIWATQFADMMTNQRRLRSESISFQEWILQPDTLAAPTWCAKFLEEGGTPGLLSTSTQHATLRVETPVVTVRINIGVNYQDLETAPDGTVLLPELEFWQTDIGFDGLRLSDNVAGLMGDTSRFVLDDEGEPVTNGLGALHAPVDSYRVAGPFAREFEQLHG